MIDRLSPHALRQLELALRARIGPTAPTPAERRRRDLRFLATLLERTTLAHRRVPYIERRLYNALRSPTDARSERLVEAYGGWPRVCRAAHRLLEDGRNAGAGLAWPAPVRRGEPRPSPYTLKELIAAVTRCASELERIPSSADYCRWAAAKRSAHTGLSTLRIPDYETVIRLGLELRWESVDGEAKGRRARHAIPRGQIWAEVLAATRLA
jgi:hypothetical protein